MIQKPEHAESTELGKLLLRIGISLLHAGTASSKTVIILLRMANSYGYDAHIDLSIRSLTISLHRQNEEHILFTGSRSMLNFSGVNFNVLASISALSWDVKEKSLPVAEAKETFEKIAQKPGYPRLLILTMVGFASAAFCFNFGGDAVQMLITFAASFLALWVKQEMMHKQFNPFLVTFVSSFIAAAIVAGFYISGCYPKPIMAFTACSLFLIPGVPLVTAFIDLMDGYILNGIERGVTSLIHAFAIALGLSSIIFLVRL